MIQDRLRADALQLREGGGSTHVKIVDSLNQAALHIDELEERLKKEIGVRKVIESAVGEMLEAHKPFNVLSLFQPKIPRKDWLSAYVTRSLLRRLMELNL